MSNPFLQMCNDKVLVVKADGTKLGPFQVTFSNHKVTLFEVDLDVDEGDSVWRELPNGKTETYTVLEVKFNQEFHAIPANFKLTVHKDTSLVAREKVQRVTNNYISNSQGFQVGDHNVQSIVDSFRSLVQKIDDSDATAAQKKEAKGLIGKVLSHPAVTAVLGSSAGATAGAALKSLMDS